MDCSVRHQSFHGVAQKNISKRITTSRGPSFQSPTFWTQELSPTQQEMFVIAKLEKKMPCCYGKLTRSKKN